MKERTSIYTKIDTKSYFTAGLSFNNKEIFIRDEVLAITPDVIIDIHSHANLPEDVVGLHPRFFSDIISTFPSFTVSQHRTTDRLLWGDKKDVRHAYFAFPFEGVNIDKSNQYIASVATDSDFPFYTSDNFQSRSTIEALKTEKWRGVKAYYRQRSPESTNITDFYPPEILEIADSRKLPIILHLPNDLEKDFLELTSLLQRYSQAKFIIAHMGFPDGKTYPELLSALKPFDNVFFESSWSINSLAIKSVIDILGPEKLLYGSDQPLNLIRAKVVINPQLGERVAVGLPYHWADQKEQQYYKDELGISVDEISTIHFQSLEAILYAVFNYTSDRNKQIELSRMIFYNNAFDLLK